MDINTSKCTPEKAGVDLNRNYGFNWNYGHPGDNECEDTFNGKKAFSEPESRAMRDL